MSPATGIGIVADDLTGGSAILGEFATPGSPARIVRWGDPGLHPAVPEDGAVVIETGSRYLDAAASTKRVRAATRDLGRRGSKILMKKIDSTLKGNVGTELAAFCAEAPGAVVIAPSCPAVGLRLVHGRHLRPSGPGVDVIQLLDGVLHEPPHLLPLETVRAGVDAVSAVVAASGAPVLLADAETQSDLDTVAAGARRAGVRSFGGTYGLGAALERTRTALAAERITRLPLADRMIVIVGSANPRTARQVDHLIKHGGVEVRIDVDAVLTGAANLEAERVRMLTERLDAPVIVVHTGAASAAVRVREHKRPSSWTDRDLAVALSAPLTAAVRALPHAGLFFVGGETTGATFDDLGWVHVDVIGELDDAVPVALTRSSGHSFIVFKPGAFGGDNVLVKAADVLLAGAQA